MKPKEKTNLDDGYVPLAARIRPRKVSDVIGQQHLIGKGKPLAVAIQKKLLFSMVFWGPPGSGKTTLARILALACDATFVELSAVSAGKADIRLVIDEAKLHPEKQTVLFLDEIHRFNKAQQDFLLPCVEDGTITLIGATTENPSFEIIAPLLSRCRVFVLEQISPEDMVPIIKKAVSTLHISIDKEALDWLIRMANGDARQAISLIEQSHTLYTTKKTLTTEILQRTLQSKFLRYDKLGDEHYNTISSYIKSMRASNIDAALYYLARMVEAGEDPLFIARRMVVFASEDVVSPTALVVANAVFQACQQIGYPECQENLAAGTVYMAQAKKDRSAYDAYMKALADVKKFGNLPIPLNIRNAPTKLMKDLGYGKGYEIYTKEDLLPEKLQGKKYYK